MPEQEPNDYVIPVVREQVQTDAVAVETGGVRVVKTVQSHEEVVAQELRRGRVEVQRVPMNQPVGGPMEPRREGNTLIIPVVSEVLRIEKQWVLTEEIHLTQFEETRTVNEKVTVNQEVAEVQRVDEEGQVISEMPAGRAPGRVLARQEDPQEPTRRVLTRNTTSLVKKT